MPQLDIVAYVGQYVWTLVVLLVLFSFLVIGVLPRIQQQLALRVWVEESITGTDEVGEIKLDVSKGGLIDIFKGLCNQ